MNQITSFNGVALRILNSPNSITSGQSMNGSFIVAPVYHKAYAHTIDQAAPQNGGIRFAGTFACGSADMLKCCRESSNDEDATCVCLRFATVGSANHLSSACPPVAFNSEDEISR